MVYSYITHAARVERIVTLNPARPSSIVEVQPPRFRDAETGRSLRPLLSPRSNPAYTEPVRPQANDERSWLTALRNRGAGQAERACSVFSASLRLCVSAVCLLNGL